MNREIKLEVRNAKDIESLGVSPKYREMKSSWKYYSGQEVAPVPTIFIGGNHEASIYLWELSREHDMQDYRQWVRSRLKDRGVKPCYPRNPQSVSLLELLELPYILDNASESRDSLASLTQRGDVPVGSLDDYGENISIEGEDEAEDVAEVDNTETENEKTREENSTEKTRTPMKKL
ncbi:hypothetical protein PTKIN_Ptkin19aG0129300 [Pterospermum kingtungense]